MQLQHNNPHESYAEEGQDRPCHFYWAVRRNGRLETDHGPVLCRDFLGDTLVWKAKEAKKGSIYSWNYTGDVETEFTSLVIDSFGKIEHNVKTILNPIERKIGVAETVVERTDDGQHVWVRGDKFWMLTTIHFSWYTTLLRYLTWHVEFKDFTELVKYPTNSWSLSSFSEFERLPYVLHDLKITSVSGYKNGGSKISDLYNMHNYNGWMSNTRPHLTEFTEYGEQLNGLLKA